MVNCTYLSTDTSDIQSMLDRYNGRKSILLIADCNEDTSYVKGDFGASYGEQFNTIPHHVMDGLEVFKLIETMVDTLTPDQLGTENNGKNVFALLTW